MPVSRSLRMGFHTHPRRCNSCLFTGTFVGAIAQLGEHLLCTQGVIGSIPVSSTNSGAIVQLVRTPACHAGGRGFDTHSSRHHRSLVQLRRTADSKSANGGLIPSTPAIIGASPSGKAADSDSAYRWSESISPCQAPRSISRTHQLPSHVSDTLCRQASALSARPSATSSTR